MQPEIKKEVTNSVDKSEFVQMIESDTNKTRKLTK